MSSYGYLFRSESKKILNFYLFIDFSYTWTSSIPISLEIDTRIASAFILVSEESKTTLVLGKVQASFPSVFLVTIHSSNWITLKFLSKPAWISYFKSAACIVISCSDGSLGIFPNLIIFFLILCLVYNFLILYTVIFDVGYLCLNKHTLYSSDLDTHFISVVWLVKNFSYSWVKSAFFSSTN